MAVSDWDIDGIAQVTLDSLLEDYPRDEIYDVLNDELEDLGWTIYSRDPSSSHAVVALVKEKIIDLL